ncbi:MAG: NADH-quinone oxidoreductase subunit I [Peptococcaceae bacterium]|nr:NADH-quinone oxidoreductase subunit I [Peptococcaceae bacterium]
MFGQGLVKGLAITLRELFNKKVTVQYPEERCYIAPRFHGEFTLDRDACINCGLCANSCPNNVIQIESEKADKKRIQTKFVMNIQYCLFCGLCVEACAKKALRFTDKFEMAKYHYASIPLVLLNKTPEEIAEEKARILAEAAKAAEARAKAEAAAAAAKPEAKDRPKPGKGSSGDGKAKGTEG